MTIMEGLKALPKAAVYGSAQNKITLGLWTDENDHPYYMPTVAVEDTISMEFGEHSIRLIPFPGHSACTLLTLIDGAYLQIADEIMFSDNGEPILPGAEPGETERHAESLKRLKAYSSYIFLPAHGRPLSGAEEIERQADKRIAYFSAILKAGGSIPYEQAIKESGGFLHSEWHEYNC
jgi:glyoxylase-like metal-dependent hydrolase (beta-lactamase superfamily II)